MLDRSTRGGVRRGPIGSTTSGNDVHTNHYVLQGSTHFGQNVDDVKDDLGRVEFVKSSVDTLLWQGRLQTPSPRW